MNNNYKRVLEYIQKQVRINYFSEIVIPPVLLTAEALKLPLDDVEEAYTELLARGIICEVSEYQYTVGQFFPLTDALKQRIGSSLTR